jgi:DNA-cytosine methyltransferase
MKNKSNNFFECVSSIITNVDTTKTINHISLCAGYGGIDIGLSRAIPNLRTIAFSEIEAYAAANLVSKMEAGLLDAAPIWTNLKTFPWEEFRGVVDIISGGFPCQPFSAAGKRKGDTDERHLFPYILEGIRKCRPSLIFLENVEGIISAKLAGDEWADPAGTPVLLYVLRELERVGYKATAGVFSASEVGAPHQRKRVFILAHSSSNGGREGWILRQGADGTELISNGESGGTPYPSRPGQPQYLWEPPRVLENTISFGRRGRNQDTSKHSGRSTAKTEVKGYCESRDIRDIQNEIESEMGGDSHGPTSGMGYGELCETVESRVDELRLLGNGVVPDTAHKAFIILFDKLTK